MTREIILQGTTIPYAIRVSPRARAVRMTVYRDLRVAVTVPRRLHAQAASVAENFLTKKSMWLMRTLTRMRARPARPTEKPMTRQEIAATKTKARTLVHARLAHFNQFYGFTIGRIAIKNQNTRWGSCSRKGNMNFNYKIALLPAHAADYIIVHELCHRGAFNHSQSFWELVARAVPNHKEIRRELRMT